MLALGIMIFTTTVVESLALDLSPYSRGVDNRDIEHPDNGFTRLILSDIAGHEKVRDVGHPWHPWHPSYRVDRYSCHLDMWGVLGL